MAFMEPVIIAGEWLEVDTANGTTFVPWECVPASVVQAIKAYEDTLEADESRQLDAQDDLSATGRLDLLEYLEVGRPEDIYTVEPVSGYGARLSAPGYMDCTDWTVHESEGEARASLADMYDLCPTCLNELDSDYRCPQCEKEQG